MDGILFTQTKKLENLFQQQECPLFNVNDTVKLFKIDLQLPWYALDKLPLRPKNPVSDKFNEIEVLAEIDNLLNHLKSNSISKDVMCNINVATYKYIKNYLTQRTRRHITMAKRYLKDNG